MLRPLAGGFSGGSSGGFRRHLPGEPASARGLTLASSTKNNYLRRGPGGL